MSQLLNKPMNESGGESEGCARWFVRDGRLRSGWRVASYATVSWSLFFVGLVFISILFVILEFVLWALLGTHFGQPPNFTSGFMNQPLPKLVGDVLVECMELAVVLIVTWLWRHFLDKKTIRSLGLTVSGKWWLELTIGVFVTGAMWTAFLGILLLTSTASVSAIQINSETLGVNLTGGLGRNILVGLNEEINYRGYILQNLIEGVGVAPALVISSVYFGLIHLLNPNPNALALTSLALGGLLMGMGYWATQSLWLPIGMHIGWNWFEGSIYGFPVSGFPRPGLLELCMTGPDWLTGGNFGPEASIMIIALQLVLIAFIFLWTRAVSRSRL